MILPRDYTDIYQNSADLRRGILITSILTPALAALFVGLRLYTARVFFRRIEKDDCRLTKPLHLLHLLI
jgi:hypothetical protein